MKNKPNDQDVIGGFKELVLWKRDFQNPTPCFTTSDFWAIHFYPSASLLWYKYLLSQPGTFPAVRTYVF